jgi:hypothetical protein
MITKGNTRITMRYLVSILSLFLLPTPFYGAPISTRNTTIPDMPLPEAIHAIQATVQSASRQGSIDIDDLQRLLDIIASHVERMREATHGGTSSRATTTVHSKAQTQDNGGQRSGGYHHHDGIGSTADVTYQGPTDSGDEHSGLVNITCKGISVCNPVTVYNGKDSKGLGTVYKEAGKAARKGNKAGKKSWWKLGRSGRWRD